MTSGQQQFEESVPIVPEGHQHAHYLSVIVRGTIGVATFLLGAIAIVQPAVRLRACVSLVTVASTGFAALALSRRGHTRAGGALLVAGLVALITANSFRAGGIRSPGINALLVFALMAGLLLGERGGLVAAGACILIDVALVVAEMYRVLPSETVHYSPLTLLLLNSIYIGVTVVLVQSAVRRLAASLQTAQREIAERRLAEHKLEHLQRLTATLSSAATLEEVARSAAEITTSALSVAAAALWSTDELGDLRLLGSYGTREAVITSFRHVPADSPLPLARVAREGQPIYHETAEDIESEPAILADTMGRLAAFRAYGVIPLVREDRVLGVLALSADRPRHFAPAERAFMASVAGYCADAVARARLYDDAHSAERRLHSVLEGLPIGIGVSRPPNSTLVFANDALAGIWKTDGFPANGEDRWRMLKVMLPDGRPMPREQAPVVRALNGEVVKAVDALIERQDGTVGWVQFSAAPILRKDGSVEMAVATVVDVTAEKEATDAAAEAGRAKDQFLAMLGHELRNPLTPILTALEVMRLRGNGHLERERSIIERQARRLVRLVDDLLDVSRSVHGSLRLERAAVELSTVIADAVEAASPLIEESSQLLETSVPATGLVVDGDRSRLAQVIINLLTNASKYSPRGGHIKVTARADGDQLSLEVSDDGTGIEPDLLPRIFEAFIQGPQGLDRKTGGLGLGLAIARQLISAHGGTIEARSDGPGRGTTVIVTLPRAATASSERSMSGGAANVPRVLTGRRILIVEDNEDTATVLCDVLVQAGHDVRVVGDGPSALQLVESYVPDVGLFDIGLPVMDGYDLARRLWRTPGLEQTPLVAITGYAQDSDRRRALARGFAEHVAKPFDFRRLLDIIERLSAPAK
jgi:signal transduction histidine kinase